MEKSDTTIEKKSFLENPEVIEHYSLLQETGVFSYIDSLNKEIRNYENLLSGALDIFNRTSIDEIMDATVWQITDRCLPSFIAFLWKPVQGRDDITVRSYRNYKPVDLKLDIQRITGFEQFFQKHSKPISFELLAFEMKDNDALRPFRELAPEIVIPIIGPFGLYGLILVGRKILSEDYLQSELVFLQQLMSFVTQAIKNHLHYEHSLRDIKTGLFNHGFFMTRLGEELARARREKYSSSIIVIDVDKFKNFNDSFGHLAGDRVLEYLAVAIKQAVRTGDVPSRFGGEEFTVLLPNTTKDVAFTVAERLRCTVAAMTVPWEPPLPQVTISLGVHSFSQGKELTAEEIIAHADEALYLSKERGRNRTTLWGSGVLFRIEHKTEQQKT
ncbi:MAG: GGDEF domain-containing protein [Treponema sp.]|jgi:diguanylate cyclase (GGDEF)-like protein|nr:GGDEF domain-containing protein [Treponema sp.]